MNIKKNSILFFIFILATAFVFISRINTGVDAPSYLIDIDNNTGYFSVQFQGEVISLPLLNIDWEDVRTKDVIPMYDKLINTIDRENIQWQSNNDYLEIWYYDNNQIQHYLNDELKALYQPL